MDSNKLCKSIDLDTLYLGTLHLYLDTLHLGTLHLYN